MKQDKIKSVPLRMCIVCKRMIPKNELLRIVCDKEGNVCIDTTNRANGRGAYVCTQPECVATCVKKRILNRAFKRELPEEVYKAISEEYEKSYRQ